MNNYYKTILRDVFEIGLAGFAVFFLIEIYYPGFASDYFNLNYILGAIIILAILTAFFPAEKEEYKFDLLGLIVNCILFLVFAVVIFLELKGIGTFFDVIITLAACSIYIKIYNILKSN